MVQAGPRSSSSSSSSSGEGKVKAKKTPAATFEPFSLGKYKVAQDHWEAADKHSSWSQVFLGHETQGYNDWAYGHNRLGNPGASEIRYRMKIAEFDTIRAEYPGCKFVVRSNYFGPWNMDPCTISVWLNDEKILKEAQVLGEH